MPVSSEPTRAAEAPDATEAVSHSSSSDSIAATTGNLPSWRTEPIRRSAAARSWPAVTTTRSSLVSHELLGRSCGAQVPRTHIVPERGERRRELVPVAAALSGDEDPVGGSEANLGIPGAHPSDVLARKQEIAALDGFGNRRELQVEAARVIADLLVRLALTDLLPLHEDAFGPLELRKSPRQGP